MYIKYLVILFLEAQASLPGDSNPHGSPKISQHDILNGITHCNLDKYNEQNGIEPHAEREVVLPKCETGQTVCNEKVNWHLQRPQYSPCNERFSDGITLQNMDVPFLQHEKGKSLQNQRVEFSKRFYFKRGQMESRVQPKADQNEEKRFPYGLPICQMETFGDLVKIGSGVNGDVFQCSQKGDQKQYALKRSNDNLSNEMEALSRLKGMGWAPDILCAGGNQTFFIMERINGFTLHKAMITHRHQSKQAKLETLSKYLKKEIPTSLSEEGETKSYKLELFRAAAIKMYSIVLELHRFNMYHCDPHAENWMILQDTSELVLIDYGNSWVTKSSEDEEKRRIGYDLDIRATTYALYQLSRTLNLQKIDLAPCFQTLFDLISEDNVTLSHQHFQVTANYLGI